MPLNINQVINAIKLISKNSTVRDLLSRVGFATGAYLLEPEIRKRVAGGSQNLPVDHKSYSQLLTAILTGLVGPKGMIKRPWISTATVTSPTLITGISHRLFGPGGLETGQKVFQNLASIIGDYTADPDTYKKYIFNHLKDFANGLVGKTWKENIQPALTPVLKDIGYGLGTGGLGAIGGYGIGKLIADKTIENPLLDPDKTNDFGAVNEYYEARRKQDMKRSAMKALMASLGGYGTSLLYINRDKIKPLFNKKSMYDTVIKNQGLTPDAGCGDYSHTQASNWFNKWNDLPENVRTNFSVRQKEWLDKHSSK